MSNYRGCENIKFVYHNEWADPDLIYRGYTFNYYDIEDALWNDFCDVTQTNDNDRSVETLDKFDAYVQDNAENYLDDCIFGGYFANGSKTWHKD